MSGPRLAPVEGYAVTNWAASRRPWCRRTESTDTATAPGYRRNTDTTAGERGGGGVSITGRPGPGHGGREWLSPPGQRGTPIARARARTRERDSQDTAPKGKHWRVNVRRLQATPWEGQHGHSVGRSIVLDRRPPGGIPGGCTYLQLSPVLPHSGGGYGVPGQQRVPAEGVGGNVAVGEGLREFVGVQRLDTWSTGPTGHGGRVCPRLVCSVCGREAPSTAGEASRVRRASVPLGVTPGLPPCG